MLHQNTLLLQWLQKSLYVPKKGATKKDMPRYFTVILRPLFYVLRYKKAFSQ